MGGKEKEGRVGGRGKGKGKGGEGKGERMWRGPESGLPRGPCWLSAGLVMLLCFADCNGNVVYSLFSISSSMRSDNYGDSSDLMLRYAGR